MKFTVRILKYVFIGTGLRLKKNVKAKSIARACIFIYISTVTDSSVWNIIMPGSDNFEFYKTKQKSIKFTHSSSLQPYFLLKLATFANPLRSRLLYRGLYP